MDVFNVFRCAQRKGGKETIWLVVDMSYVKSRREALGARVLALYVICMCTIQSVLITTYSYIHII